ncbi:unnamed protein product [Phytomonas sp. EM1]|nr:unnamed protein product [Phytomonas sp. EM1]|eukprot:CCW60823.1 unnamed protein product [Phytomonas sp. isolate EM1]
MLSSTDSNLTPQVAYSSTQACIQSFVRDLQNYDQQLSKLLDNLQGMVNDVECLHRHYDKVTKEKDCLDTILKKSEDNIRGVRRIVGRYSIVKDAVVASDGFTYERNIITEYIESCKKSGTTPISHQTNEPITSLLIPNRSLMKLLDGLTELLSTDTAHYQSEGGDNAPNQLSTIDAKGDAPSIAAGAGTTSSPSANQDSSVGGNNNNNTNRSTAEVNALGERLHPCIRVYGFCNYKGGCSYAKYPYDACLSNLKGRCRFRNHCHERHVEFCGPLDDYGRPISEPSNNTNNYSIIQNASSTVEDTMTAQKEKAESH